MELIPATAVSGAQLSATEAIYLAAFPAELRAPFTDLLADDMLVLIVDGRPAGFAVTRRLGPTGWVFLRYFAVLDRGAGLGSQMWRLLCAHWSAAGCTRILLDVEDPGEAGIDSDEESIRHRRIVFYQRLGAELLPVRDYRPSQPGGHPHPLRLIAAALDGQEAPVRDMVIAVYQYRYDTGPDDPAVQQALSTI
ncbi:MAG TPA: GNAT family N-acetyltransferase [Actinoplanes sp.]|nr:GNAT family N-acetyltransferase [Actinoplanes sp.]